MSQDDRQHRGEQDGDGASGAERESGAGCGAESGSKRRERDEGGRRERAWNPWNSFADLQETVSDLVDSAIRGVSPFATARFPRCDLVRLADGGYRLLVDLPGVEREDLEVTTVEGELNVAGVRPRPALPEGSEVLRTERGYGRFHRSIGVPADADLGRVTAKLEDGVLRVELPRRGESSRQRVEVEA